MASELTHQLQVAYHFTADDFTENTAGRLTPRQKSVLAMQRKLYWLGFGVFAFVMLASVGFFGWMSDSKGSLLDDLGFQVVSLVTLAIIGIYLPFFLSELSALNGKIIKRVEGSAKLEAHEDSPTARVTIGNVTFTLPPMEPYLSAFKDGESYAIHYLPMKRPYIISAVAVREHASRDAFSATAGAGEHPGMAIAKRAPLIMAILLIAMVAGPLFMMVFEKFLLRMELSPSAHFWSRMAAIAVFCAAYVIVIQRVIYSGRRSKG